VGGQSTLLLGSSRNHRASAAGSTRRGRLRANVGTPARSRAAICPGGDNVHYGRASAARGRRPPALLKSRGQAEGTPSIGSSHRVRPNPASVAARASCGRRSATCKARTVGLPVAPPTALHRDGSARHGRGRICRADATLRARRSACRSSVHQVRRRGSVGVEAPDRTTPGAQRQQSSSQPVLFSPLMGGVAQQPSPCQVWWPSLIARAAIASATAGSAHHRPKAALSVRPISTPAAR
jgi:hypothetical protein